MRRLRWLIAGLLSLLSAGGCRSPRPTSLSEWTACVLDHHHLECPPSGCRAGAPAELEAIPGGTGAVLYLHAEWGRSPIASEYQFGFLMVELPALAPGTVRDLKGLYREGSQALAFNSTTLQGSVEVLSSTSDRCQIGLALEAATPDVGTGARPLRGTVTARRVPDLKSCR